MCVTPPLSYQEILMWPLQILCLFQVNLGQVPGSIICFAHQAVLHQLKRACGLYLETPQVLVSPYTHTDSAALLAQGTVNTCHGWGVFAPLCTASAKTATQDCGWRIQTWTHGQKAQWQTLVTDEAAQLYTSLIVVTWRKVTRVQNKEVSSLRGFPSWF